MEQKFYLLIYVVKIVSVVDLVKKLETGRRITKESVVNDSECSGFYDDFY